MPECPYCLGNEFVLLNGYYFCEQCHIQSQECAEESLDQDAFEGGLSGRLEIRTVKTREKNYGIKWTTFDAFNLIIKKQVDALISHGATPYLKAVVLQLWINYLHKLKMVHVKTPRHKVKMNAYMRTRDFHMLFMNDSKVPTKRSINRTRHKRRQTKLKHPKSPGKSKKFRMASSDIANDSEFDVASIARSSSGSEQSDVSETENVFQSQVLSRKVYRNKRMKRRVERLVRYMTMPKTICFIYLGLLLLNDKILLCDLIRWAWEGLIPYYNAAVEVLPDDMIFQTYDNNTFRVIYPLNNEYLRAETGRLAAFLEIKELPQKSLQYITSRFIKELDLPAVMNRYVNNLLNICLPKMRWRLIQSKKINASIPNYEGRAIAFIIVALKLLFGLNDVDEWKLSQYAYKLKEINADKLFGDRDLFIWREWIRQLSHRCELQSTMWHRANRKDKFEKCIEIESLASYYANEGNSWRGKFSVNRLLKLGSLESDEVWNALCQPFHRLLREKTEVMKPSEVSPTSFPLLSESKKALLNVGKVFLPSSYSNTSLDYLIEWRLLHPNHPLSDCEAVANNRRQKKVQKEFRKYLKSYKRYFLNRNVSGHDRNWLIGLSHHFSQSFFHLLNIMADIVEMKPGVLYKDVNMIERTLLRKNEDSRGRNIIESQWDSLKLQQ